MAFTALAFVAIESIGFLIDTATSVATSAIVEASAPALAEFLGVEVVSEQAVLATEVGVNAVTAAANEFVKPNVKEAVNQDIEILNSNTNQQDKEIDTETEQNIKNL